MISESIVEDATLEWFSELGYTIGHGPHLTPGEPAAARGSFGEVVLAGRLRESIARLNPAIPEKARIEALLPKLPSGELHVAAVESKLTATVTESATAQSRKRVS